MSRDKVRIRFRKADDLRFLSHHDLMRALERMLRRADRPFHYTEGFHPKPRMVFASALALGIIGHEEVVEIELDAALDVGEVRHRLSEQAPPGLEILAVDRIEPGSSAVPEQAEYRLHFETDGFPELQERITTLLASTECWVERVRPQARRIDIRPYILRLALDAEGLTMSLRLTPGGSARPDEVVRLLGLGAVLDAGAVLERTTLVLRDEIMSPDPSVEDGLAEGTIHSCQEGPV